MNHTDVVLRAAAWLRKTQRHPIVLTETGAAGVGEQPDVIGWKGAAFSTLIECKATRSDFIADRQKPWRQHPALGMGAWRWYFIANEFVVPGDLPDNWGLASVRDRKIKIIRKPTQFYEWNQRGEMAVLVSALRRATEGWGRKIFGEIAPPMTDGDPHPSASKIIGDLRRRNEHLQSQLRELHTSHK